MHRFYPIHPGLFCFVSEPGGWGGGPLRPLRHKVCSKLFPLRRRIISSEIHVIVCSISNTRKMFSSDIETLRSRLKKRGAAEFFLNDFEVFAMDI